MFLDRGSWPSSVFSDRNVLATVSSRICFSLMMSPVSTWRSTTSSSSVILVLLVFSDLDMVRGIVGRWWMRRAVAAYLFILVASLDALLRCAVDCFVDF